MTYANRPDLVSVYFTVVGETEHAILVDHTDAGCWLPKSALEDWPDVNQFGEIILSVTLAQKKGMVY